MTTSTKAAKPTAAKPTAAKPAKPVPTERELTVLVFGPNLNNQEKGSHHVHAEGCADILRWLTREPEYANGQKVVAKSMEDVVEATYPTGEFPKREGLIEALQFFPCAYRKLPRR